MENEKDIHDKLMLEFSCAIQAVLGNLADCRGELKERIYEEDIDEICRKVKGYIYE